MVGGGIRGKLRRFAISLVLGLIASISQAERINQEGRILGPAPVVTAPTLFNTPQADAIVSAMQIMPVTNPWNENISNRPVLTNSAAMIAQVKSDLSPSRQTLRPFYEMNYVLVPDNQARVTIPFFNYPDESDLDGGTYPNGRYPIPSNMPVEGWPKETGNLTLQQWQMDVNNDGWRSAFDYRCARRRVDLGNVADEIEWDCMGSIQRRKVQSQFQCSAAGWLDVGRRGGIADVPGGCSLRRMPARNGRACLASRSRENAA